MVELYVFGFVILFIVVVIAKSYFRKVDKDKDSENKPESYTFNGNGTYDFEIVGESFRQQELEKIAGPRQLESKEHYCDAWLIYDDDNEHDGNAIAVYIDKYHVGYLSKLNAILYRKWIESVDHLKHGDYLNCKAKIVGGFIDVDTEEEYMYGVKLDFRFE